MASVKNISLADIKSHIESNKVENVYFLHGEECYFIDEAVKLFEDLLPEADRDFNQHILYSSQVEMDSVIAICRRYPIMSDRQIVILKEFQTVGKNEQAKLSSYFSNPNPLTVLVVVMRGEKLLSAPVANALKAGNCSVLESKKIYENKIASFTKSLAAERGLSIEDSGVAMLTEHIGANLAKLSNEINKLAMILGTGATITPEAIELNVGISKQYNNTELINAVARRDFVKTLKIADYFKRNPKQNSAIPCGSSLYGFFANVVTLQFLSDKSQKAMMDAVGARFSVQMESYNAALRNYNAWQTIEIISIIREFDCKVKGNGSRMNEHDLLIELLYKILFAKGQLEY